MTTVAGGKEVLVDSVLAALEQVSDEVSGYYQPRDEYLVRLVMLRAARVPDIDFETLICLSGFATSFAYHPKEYWLMYMPPDSPEVTEARIAGAVGLGWEFMDKAESVEATWEKVKASLDAGRPIMGYYYDCLLFCGYRDAATPEGRQVYAAGGFADPGWRPWAEFAKWAEENGKLGQIGAAVPRVPVADTARKAIDCMARCGDSDGRADVEWMAMGRFGFAGMEAYAADTADLTKPPDSFDAGWLGCHCANRQLSGRMCAATYLQRAAGEFPGPVRDHILAAVEHYRQASADWGEWERQLGKDAVPDAWKVADRRAAGAEALRKAIADERAACSELQAAAAHMP